MSDALTRHLDHLTSICNRIACLEEFSEEDVEELRSARDLLEAKGGQLQGNLQDVKAQVLAIMVVLQTFEQLDLAAIQAILENYGAPPMPEKSKYELTAEFLAVAINVEQLFDIAKEFGRVTREAFHE